MQWGGRAEVVSAFTRYDLIRQVNDEVNRATTYRTDSDLYARLDFWEVAAGQGDCEDYALAKRQKLLERGVPLDDLRLATVFTETREGIARHMRKQAGENMVGDHAVLICRSPIGDWILDNRFELPVQLKDTAYVIDRMQVAGTSTWEHGKE